MNLLSAAMRAVNGQIKCGEPVSQGGDFPVGRLVAAETFIFRLTFSATNPSSYAKLITGNKFPSNPRTRTLSGRAETMFVLSPNALSPPQARNTCCCGD